MAMARQREWKSFIVLPIGASCRDRDSLVTSGLYCSDQGGGRGGLGVLDACAIGQADLDVGDPHHCA
jgi:hypothetical protein